MKVKYYTYTFVMDTIIEEAVEEEEAERRLKEYGWQRVYSKSHQKFYWFNINDGQKSWDIPKIENKCNNINNNIRLISEVTNEEEHLTKKIRKDIPYIAIIVSFIKLIPPPPPHPPM